VVDNHLRFEYHENPGMAFSIGRNLPFGRYIFIVIGFVVLFVVWRIVRQIEGRKKLADIAFGLVAGGAIGNMIDRIYIGRVVDFIVMHWHKHRWPAYNIADAALVVGVVMLLIALSGEKQKQKDDGKKAAATKKSDAKPAKKR
jgi:signal peptidase II